MRIINEFIEKFKMARNWDELYVSAREAMKKKMFSVGTFLSKANELRMAERSGMTQQMQYSQQQSMGRQPSMDQRQAAQHNYMSNQQAQTQNPYGMNNMSQQNAGQQPTIKSIIEQIKRSQSRQY